MLASAVLSACSSDSSSTSTSAVTVYVQAGQEDLHNAVLRSSQILDNGLPDEDSEGRLNHTQYLTDAEGSAAPAVYSGYMQLFELVSRSADADRAQIATTARCQWQAGCGSVAFAATVSTPETGWRSVVWDMNKGERVRITPLTHLAAELAFAYAYAESPRDPADNTQAIAPEWQATGYYSPYAIEQAVSQVSRLFGILNVQSSEPADLTQINEWGGADAVTARDSIRYGALLAAWAHLEAATPGLTTTVTAEFLTHQGQWVQKGGSAALTLETLYIHARNNLNNLIGAGKVTDAQARAYVQQVIDELDQNLTAIQNVADGALTSQTPETLENLFGSSAYSSYQLGIERTKAFMAVMRNYTQTFFEDGYQEELIAYRDLIRPLGQAHEDNLDAIIQMINQTQRLYRDSALQSSCTTLYTWLAGCHWDAATQVMTLTTAPDAHTLTVSQQLADLNTADEDDSPSSSQAVDILITGTYQNNSLMFELRQGSAAPSGVRVFYEAPVSAITSDDVIAYELRWADFALYDKTTIGQANETEVTGNFRLLYRGVKNPLNDSDPRRFNIDTVVLSSRVSDVVGDSSATDANYGTLYVAARSANAGSYYPADSVVTDDYNEDGFAKFNGFFTPQTVQPEGTTESGLVSYALGTETLNGQPVEYFDFYVHQAGASSYRYRFYPDVQRADSTDINANGDTDELITTHDMAVCTLTADHSAVASCNPKQRLYTARNRQQVINDLWEAGVFSRVTVPGVGEYFVEWPATAGADGCFALDDLAQNSATSYDGTLKKAAVLGLDTLRVTTELTLADQPKTLLDVLIQAPEAERYSITAALSHDYSALSASDVYVGTGAEVDRMVLNYSTNSGFQRTGSLSVYKDGVSLTLPDSTTSVIDSELLVGLNQAYNPLPYRYVADKNGGYELCVTGNAYTAVPVFDEDSAVYSLAFRGVVYGSIRNENGLWIIRYLDGSWESLL